MNGLFTWLNTLAGSAGKWKLVVISLPVIMIFSACKDGDEAGKTVPEDTVSHAPAPGQGPNALSETEKQGWRQAAEVDHNKYLPASSTRIDRNNEPSRPFDEQLFLKQTEGLDPKRTEIYFHPGKTENDTEFVTLLKKYGGRVLKAYSVNDMRRATVELKEADMKNNFHFISECGQLNQVVMYAAPSVDEAKARQEAVR